MVRKPAREMPTYDYECQQCGKRFEVFQSMSSPKLTDCPEESCDGAVKRLLGTGSGIIFKGSGFYQTDYRSNSYNEAAKKDGGSSGHSCGSSCGCSSGSSPKESSTKDQAPKDS